MCTASTGCQRCLEWHYGAAFLLSVPWLVQPQANATLPCEGSGKSVNDRYVGPTASGSKNLFLRVLDRKENSTLLETELQCVKKGELWGQGLVAHTSRAMQFGRSAICLDVHARCSLHRHCCFLPSRKKGSTLQLRLRWAFSGKPRKCPQMQPHPRVVQHAFRVDFKAYPHM